MNDKTEIKLTLDLVDAVLQYLGTRPYQEVFKLVAALQSQAGPQVQAPEVTKEATVQ